MITYLRAHDPHVEDIAPTIPDYFLAGERPCKISRYKGLGCPWPVSDPEKLAGPPWVRARGPRPRARPGVGPWQVWWRSLRVAERPGEALGPGRALARAPGDGPKVIFKQMEPGAPGKGSAPGARGPQPKARGLGPGAAEHVCYLS